MVIASAPTVVLLPRDHSNSFRKAACPIPIPAGARGIAVVIMPSGTIKK